MLPRYDREELVVLPCGGLGVVVDQKKAVVYVLQNRKLAGVYRLVGIVDIALEPLDADEVPSGCS